MTVQEAYQLLSSDLSAIYDQREAENIAAWTIENITGWKKMERSLKKNALLPESQLGLFKKYRAELITHKPVQYVLHEAWFYGLKLYVDENVLIPRPETEELVDWLIKETKNRSPNATVLDIGTGSGCIPIAIKKNLPQSTVFSIDTSEAAIAVAGKNGNQLDAKINFLHRDILSDELDDLPQFDIIISNPPYIPDSDHSSMDKNVLEFEPHLALFTGNGDPLRFYKAIEKVASKKLKPGGQIFLEIHESFGVEVAALFSQIGYNHLEMRKDMQGKDRMVRVHH